MAEADLLSSIEVLATDAEASGFPKTATALRQVIEQAGLIRDRRICQFGNVYEIRNLDTFLN